MLTVTKLRDLWQSSISRHGGAATQVDILAGLNQMTLDVIGLAGMCSLFTEDNEKQSPHKLFHCHDFQDLVTILMR